MAQATAADIINANVQPDWLRVAIEIMSAFPAKASPRERVRVLFGGLSVELGLNDSVILGAIQARLAAAGALDRSLTGTEIHADDARGRALRHAIAVAPLRRGGDYFAFDRDEFFGLFHEKLAANAASACNT